MGSVDLNHVDWLLLVKTDVLLHSPWEVDWNHEEERFLIAIVVPWQVALLRVPSDRLLIFLLLWRRLIVNVFIFILKRAGLKPLLLFFYIIIIFFFVVILSYRRIFLLFRSLIRRFAFRLNYSYSSYLRIDWSLIIVLLNLGGLQPWKQCALRVNLVLLSFFHDLLPQHTLWCDVNGRLIVKHLSSFGHTFIGSHDVSCLFTFLNFLSQTASAIVTAEEAADKAKLGGWDKCLEPYFFLKRLRVLWCVLSRGDFCFWWEPPPPLTTDASKSCRPIERSNAGPAYIGCLADVSSLVVI